ncbi:hypothetical protein MKW98_008467 [Papaver atlanticum]|uniref:Uncharacterized protein n=1 Tax=Papaver atlanticum TaxID=357466 RepID=A0AAD4TIQ3_9MAGN|nr:hypothetical protein MKW98_008467 [Papaver atlanticum]
MDGTRRFIIACVFICTLVASNTLMCTASKNLKSSKLLYFRSLGRCSADNDQPGQPMVCACG